MSSPHLEAITLPVETPQVRLAVIVLNYCTADLALVAAQSAALDVDPQQDVVLIVDNASPNGCADEIERSLQELALPHVRLIRSPRNGGFAAGNNVGIRAVAAQHYVLLNSDTVVRPGAMKLLLTALTEDESIGIVSPQLCEENGTPQISCFRFLSLGSEFIRGASTGLVTKALRRYDVPLGVLRSVADVPWTSFACVMIKRSIFEQVGLLDEGYFMYFEDADYCRCVRRAGFRIVHEPAAQVVHLRGKSSPVKEATRLKKPRPSYFYEARARYFARGYGPLGPFLANLAWTLGLCVVWPRQIIGLKEQTMMEDEFLYNWRGKRQVKETNS